MLKMLLRTPALVIEPADIAAAAFGWEVDAKGTFLLIGAPDDQSAGFPGGFAILTVH